VAQYGVEIRLEMRMYCSIHGAFSPDFALSCTHLGHFQQPVNGFVNDIKEIRCLYGTKKGCQALSVNAQPQAVWLPSGSGRLPTKWRMTTPVGL